MRSLYSRVWASMLVVAVTTTVSAHVGSPNVYLESYAGPYHVLVTVDPPPMIPGLAQVEVRVTAGTVTGISIAPVYVNGKDQGLAPAPDLMLRSANDPQWFAGKVWL